MIHKTQLDWSEVTDAAPTDKCAFCKELTDEVLKSPASSRVSTDGAGYKTPPLEKHDSCAFPALPRSADPQQNSQEGTGGLLSPSQSYDR